LLAIADRPVAVPTIASDIGAIRVGHRIRDISRPRHGWVGMSPVAESSYAGVGPSRG
jgi:hypothetical protein